MQERLQDVHIDMAGESLGRRMLGLGGTRALKGVSETDAADCGGAGQPVCSGDQLNGVLVNCYHYVCLIKSLPHNMFARDCQTGTPGAYSINQLYIGLHFCTKAL